MKPRGRLAKWLLAWAFALLAGAASAQIQRGRKFQRVEPPHLTAAGNRVEVIEFFYYGCPVCYETEPFLSRWLVTAPEYVALRRVPALSTEAWGPLAKLFYTLDALGQIGRLHWPAYDVRGVPTFIVDGKFLTSARLAGGTRQVVQVVDQLVRL